MADESVIELLLKLKDAMSPGVHKAESQLTKFEAQLEQFEKTARHFKAVWYAGIAFEGMAFGIGEALKHMAEPAIQFEEAQQNLARATGLSTDQLGAFKTQAMALSEQLPESAQAITNAQADLARMLGSGAKAMETIGTATQFAAATGLDMTTAAQLLGSAYENLGEKTLPLKQGFRQIADLMTTLENKFSTGRDNGDMLVRSFARMAGAAQMMGVDTVQAAAAMGVLNQSGFGGGRGAGMYVEELLTQLGKLDSDGIPTIYKYGIALAGAVDTYGKFHMDLLGTLRNMEHANPARLEAYIKSLGTEGGALELLLQHYDALHHAVDTLGRAQGATASLAGEMNKGWAQQLTDLHHTYQNLEQSLGEVLVPMLIEIAHWLEPIIDGFRKFAEAHPGVVKVALAVGLVLTGLLAIGGAIAILTSALGGITATIGLATAAMEDFDVAMLANPIGLVIAAVAALGVAAYELIEHWQAVKDFFAGLAPVLEAPFIEAWQRIEGFIGLAEEWGRDFIHAIVQGLRSGVSDLEHGMHKVTDTIKKFLPFHHSARGHAAAQDHGRLAVHHAIAHTLRAAPVAAAVGALAFGAAPPIAAGAGMSGGVHFNINVNAGPGANGEELADQILHAIQANRHRFTDEIAEMHDRAKAHRSATEF